MSIEKNPNAMVALAGNQSVDRLVYMVQGPQPGSSHLRSRLSWEAGYQVLLQNLDSHGALATFGVGPVSCPHSTRNHVGDLPESALEGVCSTSSSYNSIPFHSVVALVVDSGRNAK
eukprot:m.121002 g.121002  ORF g.121002 m.121002 type:complete len:116 (-) comp21871_c0_seq1:16-363(-)